MIKKLILLILTLSYSNACHIDINATIYPKEQVIKATIIKDKKHKQTLHQKYPKQISEHFVSLLDWYTPPKTLCSYTLSVRLPASFTAISESESISVQEDEEYKIFHFSINKPIDYVNIIASDDYVVQSEFYNDINISSYFFSEHAHLSEQYIKKTKAFLKLYETMIAPYPFKTFNIVENKFQTGLSMPTFTLIGSRIIDKSFLLETSLGHEILHQWFGNSVFNNIQKGNWIEGITTFLADHNYEIKKGEDYLYRKNILHNYEVYIDKTNNFALNKFRYKKDKASSAIGYGKGTFAFHMLQKSIGKEQFFTILKKFYQKYQFKKISYVDIEKFFSKESGKNLKPLFAFLFEEKSIIELKTSPVNVLYNEGKYHIDFNISTGLSTEGLTLPLTLMINDSIHHVEIENNSTVSLVTETRPHKLTLDPNYNLFRKLSENEKMLTLSMLFTDIPISKILQQGIQKNTKKGFEIGIEKDLGSKKGFRLHIKSSDNKQLQHMQYKLPHYGKYQHLHFVDGKVVKKQKPSSQNGIQIELAKKNQIIKVPKPMNVQELIEQIENKKLIFIGEQHTKFSHHINQLNIIKALHKKGKKITIALEMFQRSFQPVLDNYIARKIDEKTFLEKSEYFKRWGFDYLHYKPIIDYAKKHTLPLIALNLEEEITKKISKEGLSSLTKEEEKKIPQDLSFSDKAYHKRLMEVFNDPYHVAAMPNSHRMYPSRLYQSQILWDETMAETIAEYIKSHPDQTVVVIVGSGHLKNYSGIPKRVKRRIDVDMSVILQDYQADVDIADFILHTSTLKTKRSPKLGIMLEADTLKVLSIIKNSTAEKMGIKKGDIIQSFLDMKTSSLADLKLALYYYRNHDNFNITVKRGGKDVHLKGTFSQIE